MTMYKSTKVVQHGLEIEEQYFSDGSDILITNLFFHHPSEGATKVFINGVLAYDNIDAVTDFKNGKEARCGNFHL